MKTYLCTNIPVDMICCIDVKGKITPMRFRFTAKSGERVIVNVECVLASNQEVSKNVVTFECVATLFGAKKQFHLCYSNFSGKWFISKIGE